MPPAESRAFWESIIEGLNDRLEALGDEEEDDEDEDENEEEEEDEEV